MPDYGVHVKQQATAVSTPVTADAGLPFVVGTAPVHTAANPAKPNVPTLVTNWDEAVEKFGFGYDWKKYTLCEFMHSHFQLYGCSPVIFVNVLDAGSTRALDEQEYDVKSHRVTLPFETVNDTTLKVTLTTEDATELARDKDYSVVYDADAGACIVELLSSGDRYGETKLKVSGNKINTEGTDANAIVKGLATIDSCVNTVAAVPDLIVAPGWSQKSEVAAVMAAKAASISGLFTAKAIIDIDSGASGAKDYGAVLGKKTELNLTDKNEIVCWPMLRLGGRIYHQSSHLAGLMAQVDTENGGAPYESPSNKGYQIDGACLEDGTEVQLTFEQANVIRDNGIVTALNFAQNGWVAWGSNTACYPANTDVKDYFIPIGRMFDWVGSTLIRTFWSRIDRPMTRRLIDNILDSCNIWLNGLVGSGILLGARVEMIESENALTDLMQGIIKLHVYITPPSPTQEIDFTLEYDANYVSAALSA